MIEKKYITDNPTLIHEWNWEKNEPLKLDPGILTAGSRKKAWWKCGKGHEWQATISNRNKGRGCPICKSERRTSFPEYALVYYLEKTGVDVIHSYRENGYELDVYIPAKKTAIEYDGYYWHKDKEKKDLEKNFKCKRDGIKLYRIREGLFPLNDSSIDRVIQHDRKDLSKAIQEILYEITGTDADIDLKRDLILIENTRVHAEKKGSLLFLNPKLANEWNYEKNCNLKPEDFAANSRKSAWWRCPRGHEWQARIDSRSTGNDCPYCSSIRVLSGETDLATRNPLLAEEWNYTLNGDLKPTDVLPSSNKKVWWKCGKGHEWQAIISGRNSGKGCPYCFKRRLHPSSSPDI